MDCRQFRSKHVAYVDDLLPAVEMAEMLGHASVCDRCARQDTAIRRSLMIVRSLPSIEPSPDFMARLTERLQALPASHEYDRARTATSFLPPLGAIAALAAGVAAVAYMALQTSRYYAPDGPAIEPAIAAATIPISAPMAAPMANAAFMASVPTAMPVWPGVLMVGQAPMRFASATLENMAETR